MISDTCSKCGKIIEAYTQKQLETLMAQHQIRHQNEAKKIEVENATA
mgnify:CR=1 FL=1